MRNICLVPSQICICLIVSAEMFKWFSLWRVKAIHPQISFPAYDPQWQGLSTVSVRNVCVAWFAVWLLFVSVLYPRWHVIFQHRLFFKTITFPNFAERDVHLLKCELKCLEKKNQILILICKVAINCYFSEEASLKMASFDVY